MTVEIELKFQVGASHWAALRRAVGTPEARRQVLAARYFDTAAQDLARARVALRLRSEGGTWVQTLKAEGATAMHRLEHNVALPGRGRPSLDLARHAGTEAAARLAQALAGSAEPELQERYATRVTRLTRRLQHQGAEIELALDSGSLRAQGRQQPIRELEFELLSGPPEALADLAGQWVDRHGLVLDVRSKSERGSLLAAGQDVAAPVPAAPLVLPRERGAVAAVQAMLRNALAQVLPNASQVAAGGHGPEHVHQLRVGLRRLRSAQRLFGAAWPALEAALQAPALAALLRALGATRDRDVLAEVLGPALAAPPAPPVPPAPPAPPPPADASADALVTGADADAVAVLRAPATQRLWLALLVLAQSAAATRVDGEPADAARALLPAVRRLYRQVQREARRFDELDEAGRHRLRRRIKRLRYGLEFLADALPRRRLRRLLAALRAAQDRLGACNDADVALQHCRRRCEADPTAWYAVGWLAARQAPLRAGAAQAVAALAGLPQPLRRRRVR